MHEKAVQRSHRARSLEKGSGIHLQVIMGNIQRKEYDATNNPAIKNPDWMSLVPDGKSLCDLSIPGTSKSTWLEGGDFIQRQSWNLTTQYEAGIRFIDISLKYTHENLSVFSGTGQNHSFDAVFTDTINFLRNHSKEVILIRLCEEYSIFGKGKLFPQLVIRYVLDAGLSWFWKAPGIPTLGQVRGKIIILRDFDGPVIGIPCKNFIVADHAYVPTIFDIGHKWASVKKNLTEAQNSKANNMYLTFTSGCSTGAYPYSVAREINYKLYNFLEHSEKKKNRWGIIAMDFPGSYLIQTIIQNN
ncbi:uncharacterized protein LOC115473872 [Microcaecilia unicolor]|uniref:Uncharacterized protein LOC115473872 n=1 Tax=Microcaecilia unicolor TaxID=1415580 RepID=A0A6P7YBL6_9AMPH|nr:uncharacterized protein LOC115473872 [Microcaecilia unicolor]